MGQREEIFKVKFKLEVMQVKEREGTWEGKTFKNTEVACVVRTMTNEYFGMMQGVRLPESLKATRPGNYEGELAFDYATDIRAYRVRIESLAAAKAA